MSDAVVTQPEPAKVAPTDRAPFRIGIPKEITPGERRVAAVPGTVAKLTKLGAEVVIEAGAGLAASFPDDAYEGAGARVVPDAARVFAECDLILKVREPYFDAASNRHEADLLRPGSRLISFVWPAQNAALLDRLARRQVTVLAMDSVPRITRAQRHDALSAMANVAGYRAVIEAAHAYGRFLGGQITAAGRVKPATVFVIGAGVAGLAAIGAARSLGAVVKAFDTREAVREQVESMGARFVTFQFDESGEGEGGYARQMSESFLAKEQAFIAKECETADIVITTALVPGKPAPPLVTSGAVVGMEPGSVIVDLAAEQGGNCAFTERDKVVSRYGVQILGFTDLTSRLATQSSELYARTVYNVVEELVTNGEFRLDLGDEIQRGMLVLQDGVLMWPPPKLEVRAAAPQPAKSPALQEVASAPASPWLGRIATGFVAALTVVLGIFAPAALLEHITVFLLACVVGWHVVWNVTPALHTPLMSVTNAISGIIVIGGMLLTAGREVGPGNLLAAFAVLVASINVAGGFLVTQRMLKMFRK